MKQGWEQSTGISGISFQGESSLVLFWICETDSSESEKQGGGDETGVPATFWQVCAYLWQVCAFLAGASCHVLAGLCLPLAGLCIFGRSV